MPAIEIGDVVPWSIFRRPTFQIGNILEVHTRLSKADRYGISCILSLNGIPYLGFQMAYLHLTLANIKCHRQGYAVFENEYLENFEIYDKNHDWQQIGSHHRL